MVFFFCNRNDYRLAGTNNKKKQRERNFCKHLKEEQEIKLEGFFYIFSNDIEKSFFHLFLKLMTKKHIFENNKMVYFECQIKTKFVRLRVAGTEGCYKIERNIEYFRCIVFNFVDIEIFSKRKT